MNIDNYIPINLHTIEVGKIDKEDMAHKYNIASYTLKKNIADSDLNYQILINSDQVTKYVKEYVINRITTCF